ncbi:uncharacterized protein LOC129924420 isoform X2 [Biomphalaria glabrata]|uniref:Uncharacterized protein LOC129924420 isoform X2 n=1 Tax=Biomphalaria glabrata TaxID=6526 RepID=A0A9W2ZI30_BIOGL|nr:uncharacterized protein LOC129924420 isoform X2 [Biomphalaria glabrata]
MIDYLDLSTLLMGLTALFNSRCDQSDSREIYMAPSKTRRELNVEAAKKSYETKKKERSKLLEKNQDLVEQQKELLREMARLQETFDNCQRAWEYMMHACDEMDYEDVTSSAINNSACIDVTSPDIDNSVYIEDTSSTTDSATFIPEEDELAGSRLETELSNETIALDLSLKTSAARADLATYCHNECTFIQRPVTYEAKEEDGASIDLGSTLDLGATQEVEHRVRKRTKRVTFADDSNVKKYKSDLFTPKMCQSVNC